MLNLYCILNNSFQFNKQFLNASLFKTLGYKAKTLSYSGRVRPFTGIWCVAYDLVHVYVPALPTASFWASSQFLMRRLPKTGINTLGILRREWSIQGWERAWGQAGMEPTKVVFEFGLGWEWERTRSFWENLGLCQSRSIGLWKEPWISHNGGVGDVHAMSWENRLGSDGEVNLDLFHCSEGSPMLGSHGTWVWGHGACTTTVGTGLVRRPHLLCKEPVNSFMFCFCF